ncbi:MAG: DUF3048 domain-containing protein, partial [Clostridia bacterium]|nr:DUF3048 domain-containing protein [Clostridia bacterium]
SLFGCKSTPVDVPLEVEDTPTDVSSVPSVPEIKYEVNPLTGELNILPEEVGKRPVAVMINNYKDSRNNAQGVQASLADADIIFESLAEGGITRLMAVFYDVSKVGQIGTVRSARYTYAQLALSLDAIYVHCGMDDVYTRPYCKSEGVSFFDLGARGYSFRESNGLAYEHTLYTTGEKLVAGFEKAKFRTEVKKSHSGTYFSFNDPENDTQYENKCVALETPMSSSFQSRFVFDSKTNKYVRYVNGEPQKDIKTDKVTAVDNVLILQDTYSYFSDNYHLRASLTSGEGMYFSPEGYCKIKWSKGSATNKFTLTDENGNPFSLNAGKTWVAIAPASRSIVIEHGPN